AQANWQHLPDDVFGGLDTATSVELPALDIKVQGTTEKFAGGRTEYYSVVDKFLKIVEKYLPLYMKQIKDDYAIFLAKSTTLGKNSFYFKKEYQD
ncbi:hypothetical protein LB456_13655, partial [Psychroflexus sp. CAK57W]|uniref:hypothetical protein n=1 Tax=Psychroflexus curvus TaxID=2873595 RepID=UPI001CC8F3FE